VINEAIDSSLDSLYISLPGRVVRYDSATQQVDVQPIPKVRHVDENGTPVVQQLPVVPSVPVVFPGGGGFAVTFPITVGDTVLLVFSGVSIDKWLQSGSDAPVDPETYARHALADAVAIPGLRNFARPRPAPVANAVAIGAETGAQIHVGSSEVKLGGAGSAEALVKGTSFITDLGTMLGLLSTAVKGLQSAVAAAGQAGAAAAVTAATTGAGGLDPFTLGILSYLSTVSKTS
jgi:hypothetical protein